MSNLKQSYSIILPTFNEVGHIEKLIREIYEIFKKKTVLFEIIIVDDNSIDGTIKVIERLSKTSNKIISIIRKNKKGSLVNSINDGIKKSKYNNIIWLDADFSHPPKYMNDLIDYKKNIKDVDLIVFSRFLKKSVRYYQKDKTKISFIDILSYLLNAICRLTLNKNFTDYTSGYICIKKTSLQNYNLKGYYGDYFINLIVDCFLKKKSIIELPYIEKKRNSGVSKTTFKKFDFIIKFFFYLIVLIKYKIKLLLK